MKKVILALVLAGISSQAFALNPRCEKLLARDAATRVAKHYPQVSLNLREISVIDTGKMDMVAVNIPASRTEGNLSFIANYVADEDCTSVTFQGIRTQGVVHGEYQDNVE